MAKDHFFFKMDMLILLALRKQDCYGYELVHIIKEQRHGVIVFRDAAKPVLVHAQIRNRLLCAVGVHAVRFRLTGQLFELLLLRPRQLNAGLFSPVLQVPSPLF